MRVGVRVRDTVRVRVRVESLFTPYSTLKLHATNQQGSILHVHSDLHMFYILVYFSTVTILQFETVTPTLLFVVTPMSTPMTIFIIVTHKTF